MIKAGVKAWRYSEGTEEMNRMKRELERPMAHGNGHFGAYGASVTVPHTYSGQGDEEVGAPAAPRPSSYAAGAGN